MKKLISLFAVVAVMSIVGCGGAKDANKDKNEEQKAPVKLDGTYKVTSYICEEIKNSEILGLLFSSMSFSFAGEELTLEYLQDDNLTKADGTQIPATAIRTYMMNSSVGENTVDIKEVKSSNERSECPSVPLYNVDRGEPSNKNKVGQFSATYRLNGKTLTFAVEKDMFCSDTRAKITAEKQ